MQTKMILGLVSHGLVIKGKLLCFDYVSQEISFPVEVNQQPRDLSYMVTVGFKRTQADRERHGQLRSPRYDISRHFITVI